MTVFMLGWSRTLENKTFNRQTLLDALNAIPEVANWRASVGSIFVVSESSADQLTDLLREKIPGLQFIFVPMNVNEVQGWADKATWNFVENPRRADS